ncbi:MAG: MGMT family protein [Candidatus Melainabacteria bacterium]|nr:MGMT family protein [Candidatus Melainabacteria bacterium]
MKTYRKVYNLVKKIPKGKVSTYGQIGQFLNLDPRVVGWALNRLANGRKKKLACQVTISPSRRLAQSSSVPWQRVINSKGGISTNRLINIPLDLQKKLLEKEGIKFNKKEKIDLKKYLWRKS